MFKFKVSEKDNAVNRIKRRFNKKPLLYRAKVFLSVEIKAWWIYHFG